MKRIKYELSVADASQNSKEQTKWDIVISGWSDAIVREILDYIFADIKEHKHVYCITRGHFSITIGKFNDQKEAIKRYEICDEIVTDLKLLFDKLK